MPRVTIGGRDLGKVLRAPFRGRNYVAARNMLAVYTRPADAMARYVLGRGDYPMTATLRSPLGPVRLTLYSHDDLLTVNEIFCRQDYPASARDRVVVDFGSNIGISAAWFLSRGPHTFAYLFEPLPANVIRLEQNLAAFDGRFRLSPVAVGLMNGKVEFGFEDTGRYGGVGVHTGHSMSVACRDANEVLDGILARHGRIDVLKIDTETMEREIVERLPGAARARIERIYVECRFTANPLASTHRHRQRGGVAQFRSIA
jgi:FkbM family methyltransferase